jgi:adenylate kinase family enzyme
VDTSRASRIVLLGPAGSGKTTLGRTLAAARGVPFVCLDDIWQPSWTAADTPRFREIVAAAHAGEAWISDGNFAAVTFDLRLPRADLIVWLDRPRLGCAWRAFKRVFRAGEAHRIGGLAKAMAFIWNFNRVNRPRIEAARRAHGPNVPVIRLTSASDVAAFLREASAVQA